MQLSEYLRTQDPDLKGYSRRNIYNMVSYRKQSFYGFIDSVMGSHLSDSCSDSVSFVLCMASF